MLVQELDPKDGGLQPLVLITKNAGRREMLGYRRWGTITVDGRKFVSSRMRASGLPPHVYIEAS